MMFENTTESEIGNDTLPTTTPATETKKEKSADKKSEKDPVLDSVKDPVMLTKLQVDVLRYFSNLPANRQVLLLEESAIEFVSLAEAVSKHRKSALEDDDIAVEKMLAEQAPNKAGERTALLDTRYRASIERFAKRGLTPAMIAKHLSEVERGNYPKRAKTWKFTPAIIGKFMKDNEIEIIKKTA
jgi:hypothetical protein